MDVVNEQWLRRAAEECADWSLDVEQWQGHQAGLEQGLVALLARVRAEGDALCEHGRQLREFRNSLDALIGAAPSASGDPGAQAQGEVDRDPFDVAPTRADIAAAHGALRQKRFAAVKALRALLRESEERLL